MAPRLLDKNLREVCRLPLLTYSLVEQLSPLSMAKLTLPAGNLAVRDDVELYTPRGSAGIFRVKSLSTDAGGCTEAVLQHGLCSLADHMHPGEDERTGSLRTLLTAILANQSRWVLGDCEVPEDQELTWKINHSNDLQSLTDILSELPGYRVVTDQRTLPWVLHIRALPSEVGCECRLARNLTDVQIDYDASDMCTRAYADGLDTPMDADTIGKWGEIARHISMDEDLGKDIIRKTVTRYLEKNKNPRLTITLTAVELSRLTGEPFDAFETGQLCRCILPDMTTVLRIVTIQRPDPIGSPEHAVLTLAAVQDDLSITIAGLVVDTRHVNQLYQKMEKNLRVEAETIELLATDIALKASQADLTAMGIRLSQAEIDIDGVNAEIELRARQSTVDALSGRITVAETVIEQTAKDLTLYVRKDDDISAMINLSGDGVNISGGVITLDGYVKADELYAEIATLDKLYVPGGIECNYITALGVITLGEVHVDDISGNAAMFSSIVVNDAPVATQAWVGEQGYLKAVPSELFGITSINGVSLSESYVATRKWVEDRGYLTSLPDSISTSSLSATTFKLNDTHVYWKSETVVTGLDVSTGRIQNIPVVTNINKTTKTIHYLGY